MFETMYNAEGIGLAAPQVGLDIRMFIVDLEPLAEDNPVFSGFKKVFINPKIVEFSGDTIKMDEGCLSLPGACLLHQDIWYGTSLSDHTFP